MLAAFVAITVLCAPLAARAQTAKAAPYPNKPVRLIVPFSPGGTNDILARMIATHLSQTWGESFIVDNRAGGEGLIGTEIAVKAKPDGYTLLLVSSAYVMNPAVRKLPFDSLTALDFIGKLGASFIVLSVGPSMPVNSVKDLLAVAKSKPGELVLTTSGGFQYFASALFTSLSKHDFNIVLYKGAVPAMIDVIGGQAHVTFGVSVPALPHLRSGKLKGLAVGTLKRAELLPDIPTLDESGLKGYFDTGWQGIFSAPRTPPAIVTRLNGEFAKVLALPEIVRQLADRNYEVVRSSPESFSKAIEEGVAQYAKVIREANIKAD